MEAEPVRLEGRSYETAEELLGRVTVLDPDSPPHALISPD